MFDEFYENESDFLLYNPFIREIHLPFDSLNIDSDSETPTKTNTSEKQNKFFDIRKVKKIGRKRYRDNQKEGEKCHSKYSYDNIIRKIQVDFQNFLICFINDILMKFGIKKKFLNIGYENKKLIKKEYVESLKSIEIGQILNQNISTKYRKQFKEDKDKNNKLYLEVIKYDGIRKILSEKYINIFRNFYYKNKRDLNDYGLNIKLSNEVKTYQDLLDKNSKNSEYIEKINIFVKKYYLPKFVIQKYI